MSSFFSEKILKQIKSNESDTVEINNFLSKQECDYFLDYFTNLKNKSIGKSQFIEREESSKIFFKFDLKNKLFFNGGNEYP